MKNKMSQLLFLFLLIFFFNFGAFSSDSEACSSNTPYNQTLATRFWNCCRVSYCPQQYIKNFNCGEVCQTLNLTDVIDFTSSKEVLQFYTGYSSQDNSIYLVFRGTEFNSLKSWIQDAEFVKIDYPYCDNCKVHSGFYEDYKNYLNAFVFASLEKLSQDYQTKNVNIMGHSMGGAFTVLAALEIILSNKFQVKHITTFGCPRVGNKHFAHYFNEQVKNIWHYRIVHYKDLVPHLPPDFIGYYHTDEEVWYYPENSSEKKMCSCGIEDPRCSNSEEIFSIDDHLLYMNLSDHACSDSLYQENSELI